MTPNSLMEADNRTAEVKRANAYCEAIVAAHYKAAASPEGRELHQRIVRLATGLIEEASEDQALFQACAAAAAIVPHVAGTVFTAHGMLAAAMRGSDENSEPEELPLLLAIEEYLLFLRLSPALTFYPHDEGRVLG